IDRGDDIPGSRAPDIWFSFLKTNDAAELAGVCRHNLLDIAGLASILGALCDIACDPERYGEKYGADFETLARRIRRHRRSYNGSDTAPPEMEIAERAALEAAVRLGSPLAMFLLGKDLLRDRQYGAAFGLLGGLAERTDTALAAVAARALAVDSEWRLLDTSRALRYAEKSLFLAGDEGPLKEDALRRIDRLLRKRERGGLQPALIQ
ncbi:MAG: ribonuclease H-like domain-containing protein, partial [Spirochaetaceae bacterium]|nr:ribonuclease H-like domain-containing protein [Spirochaetaceae bacterium]